MILYVNNSVNSRKSLTALLMKMLLRIVAASFNLRPSFRTISENLGGVD